MGHGALAKINQFVGSCSRLRAWAGASELCSKVSKKGRAMLPSIPEEMQNASLEDLEIIVNKPRHNSEMINWVHDAYDEIRRRGLDVEHQDDETESGYYAIVEA
jgi:hypothetical protein